MNRALRLRLLLSLMALLVLGLLAGLATGTQGLRPLQLLAEWQLDSGELIVGQIRAPRTVGALLVGALLGLGGALAQGLFRNPLADPYLLGSASGAGLGRGCWCWPAPAWPAPAASAWPAPRSCQRIGLVGAAFIGALAGVGLTLMLGARRDADPAPAARRRGRRRAARRGQRPDHRRLARGAVGQAGLLAGQHELPGLAGGRPDGARSAADPGARPAPGPGAGCADPGRGQRDQPRHRPRSRARLLLVSLLAAATALAVSQAGLVAFVGLVAPHLVRRHAPGAHAWLLGASALMGAVLLVLADVVSRALIAPQELPVGVVTAVFGGGYLFVLLRRRGIA